MPTALFAQASIPDAQPTAGELPPLPNGYVLGEGDAIRLGIPGRPEFQLDTQIQPDGTIVLPLLGSTVRVAGMTPQELQNDVAARLVAGGFYTDPVVNVVVTGYVSSYVNVLGRVNNPGPVAITRNLRLSDIIARVGGIAADGSEEIQLTRLDGTTSAYSLQQIATGNEEFDPFVQAGDKVYVARLNVAELPVFYIEGAVNSSNRYPLSAGLTVRQAIALAGGVTSLGSRKKVTIIKSDGTKIKKVDLEYKVEEGDTIEVGQRLF
ncbi:MAG: SLBB domain-containing protein [Pseudomonadota bacterium]